MNVKFYLKSIGVNMRRLLLSVVISTALTLPASAQSFQQGGQYSNDDRRVSLGLTIPIGRRGSHVERQPRLDMVFDHRRSDANGFEVQDFTHLQSKRPLRIGFTLSDKPQMMLNGRAIPQTDDQKNISTGVWIGAGVVAALGIGLYVAIMTQEPYD
jgi:hypothetical protein